jgi:hypothetical protein
MTEKSDKEMQTAAIIAPHHPEVAAFLQSQRHRADQCYKTATFAMLVWNFRCSF